MGIGFLYKRRKWEMSNDQCEKEQAIIHVLERKKFYRDRDQRVYWVSRMAQKPFGEDFLLQEYWKKAPTELRPISDRS